MCITADPRNEIMQNKIKKATFLRKRYLLGGVHNKNVNKLNRYHLFLTKAARYTKCSKCYRVQVVAFVSLGSGPSFALLNIITLFSRVEAQRSIG